MAQRKSIMIFMYTSNTKCIARSGGFRSSSRDDLQPTTSLSPESRCLSLYNKATISSIQLADSSSLGIKERSAIVPLTTVAHMPTHNTHVPFVMCVYWILLTHGISFQQSMGWIMRNMQGVPGPVEHM